MSQITQPLVGFQYLQEINPSEFDEFPIYLCGLPRCQFLGYANEIVAHVRTDQHIQGYLEVNGAIKSPKPEVEPEVVQILFEYDSESVNGDLVQLIHRVTDTLEYNQAQWALITKNFHYKKNLFWVLKVPKNFNFDF